VLRVSHAVGLGVVAAHDFVFGVHVLDGWL
jgi:hypothetical protein